MCGYHSIIYGLNKILHINPPFDAPIDSELGIEASTSDILRLKLEILDEMNNRGLLNIFKEIYPNSEDNDRHENRVYWLTRSVLDSNHPNTWLSDPEISIIAEIYNINIHVFLPEGVWYIYGPLLEGLDKIYILNEGNAHFSALLAPISGGSKNKEEEYTFF